MEVTYVWDSEPTADCRLIAQAIRERLMGTTHSAKRVFITHDYDVSCDAHLTGTLRRSGSSAGRSFKVFPDDIVIRLALVPYDTQMSTVCVREERGGLFMVTVHIHMHDEPDKIADNVVEYITANHRVKKSEWLVLLERDIRERRIQKLNESLQRAREDETRHILALQQVRADINDIEVAMSALHGYQPVPPPGTIEVKDVTDKLCQCVTQPVHIQDRFGITRNLGSFRVVIRTEYPEVEITSLRPIYVSGKRMHHPHTNEDGRPCWGSIENEIPRLLTDGKLGEALILIWEFLTSVDEEDHWGQRLLAWPSTGGEEDWYYDPNNGVTWDDVYGEEDEE